MTVFVDSDVVISSLLSSSGAAYLLLNTKIITPIISNYSLQEIKEVIKRLKIDKEVLQKLTRKLKILMIKDELREIKKKYGVYVTDVNDAHIVAGAKMAKTRFLISYNIRHFKVEKIKRDLNIMALTPAKFLQYLRSLE